MALIPSSAYPAQIDTGDAAYPHGKARNAGSFQDGTGTPLEKDWLNDLWGFLQAVLAGASITPSGDPDKVGASQYLDAIKKIARVNPVIQPISLSGIEGVITLDETTDILSITSVAGGYFGITGFTGGWEGRHLRVFNLSAVHSFVQLLRSTTGTVTNRIEFNFHDMGGSVAPTMYEGMGIDLWYVGSRWRPIDFKQRDGIPG